MFAPSSCARAEQRVVTGPFDEDVVAGREQRGECLEVRARRSGGRRDLAGVDAVAIGDGLEQRRIAVVVAAVERQRLARAAKVIERARQHVAAGEIERRRRPRLRPLQVRRVKSHPAILPDRLCRVSFRRALGPFDATMVVIGGIIGSGIFINPYIVAQRLDSSAARARRRGRPAGSSRSRARTLTPSSARCFRRPAGSTSTCATAGIRSPAFSTAGRSCC